MSSKSSLPLVLFVFLNLLFLGLAASTSDCMSPPKHSTHKHKHHSHKSKSPTSPSMPGSNPPSASPATPQRAPGSPGPRVSPPISFPNFKKSGTCPRNAIRFGACAKVLGGLLGVEVGNAPKKPCCRLFGGLVEAESAVSLYQAIKANVLGFNLNIPVSFGLVLNVCDVQTPPGFQCA
uniref:Hydrophobic seed protein domain-containing protein n=1 Tax=Daucus carota subsp. sativus TaxID=79200 RepID=A0A175YIR8_DAUCS